MALKVTALYGRVVSRWDQIWSTATLHTLHSAELLTDICVVFGDVRSCPAPQTVRCNAACRLMTPALHNLYVWLECEMSLPGSCLGTAGYQFRGGVLEGCGTFRRQGLARGSSLLRGGLWWWWLDPASYQSSLHRDPPWCSKWRSKLQLTGSSCSGCLHRYPFLPSRTLPHQHINQSCILPPVILLLLKFYSHSAQAVSSAFTPTVDKMRQNRPTTPRPRLGYFIETWSSSFVKYGQQQQPTVWRLLKN